MDRNLNKFTNEILRRELPQKIWRSMIEDTTHETKKLK